MERGTKRGSCKRQKEEDEQNIWNPLNSDDAVLGTCCNSPQKKRRCKKSPISTRAPLRFMDGNGGCSLGGQFIDNFFPKSFKGHSPVNKPKGSLGVACQDKDQENNENLQEKRNKSVCLISVKPGCQDGTDPGTQGTGFVFVDNIIQTSDHVLRPYLEGNELKENVNVSAVFNFDDAEQKENHLCFTAENTLVARNDELDYAFLQLKPADMAVPPGLARHIAPQPESGRIGNSGHSKGGVKMSESTQIIAPGNRIKVVDDHLAQYKNFPITRLSIIQILKNQGIEKIMGGEFTYKVATYHSPMFEGASGSPVFVGGKVFAMHTRGYYGFEENPTYVLTYGVDQLTITTSLVCKLKQSRNVEMLERLKLEARFNQYLSLILKVEPMEVNLLHCVAKRTRMLL